jgi:Fe-S-cluster containining protein
MEIKLSNYFPNLYSQFFPEFFNSLIEKEKIATCSNCIMLKPENEIGQQNYYSEKSKCCTFSPEIPNYLVGLILKDDSKEFESGREKIKEIISKGVGVSPEGIKPTRKYSLMYEKGKQSSFGKSTYLICPFFENKENSCSVWNGRSAICSTFFCRYNAGTFGENFWRNIQFYLQETEKKLSQYAILKLNAFTDYFDHTPKNTDFKLFEVDEIIHPDYIKIWGDWNNKEVDFYIKTYEIISELNQDDFYTIMGVSNDYLIKKIQNAKSLIDKKKTTQLFKFE